MARVQDPPLTPCPPWCEEPAGHDWEDEWANGLIRYHRWSQSIKSICSATCVHTQHIRIEEVEQHTADGTVRQRRIVLDVEAPTELDVAQAEHAIEVLAEAVALAKADITEAGEVR